MKSWYDKANKPADTNPVIVGPPEKKRVQSKEEDVFFGIHSGELFDKKTARELADSIESTVTHRSAGSISSLIKDILPEKRKDRTKKARHHREEDELLKSLIDLKVNNASAGMNLLPKIKSGSNTDYDEARDRLEEISLNHDLEKVVEDLLDDWFTTDSMILYWRVNSLSDEKSVPTEENLKAGDIDNICAINPATVDWDNSLGSDILRIEIPKSLVDRINQALRKANGNKEQEKSIIAGLEKEGIHIKYIRAVQAREDTVELKNDDGDFWIIKTKARKLQGLAYPSMYSIFMPLAQRRMLDEGAFSAAILVKNFIMMIKQGESITQGPMAGQRKNWITKDEAREVNEKFSTTAKAMRVVVNHTTTIEFVIPPKEIFSKDQFERCEGRIFLWANVPFVLLTGEGGNYSGGYIGIRPLLSDISKARRKIFLMLLEFFQDDNVRKLLGGDYGVATDFNENILKEPKQILDEIKFLFTSSITDQETTLREMNRDPDAVKASRKIAKEENDSQELWEPIGGQDTSFGFNNDNQDDPGGRPANEGTTEDERTRTQSPTPN